MTNRKILVFGRHCRALQNPTEGSIDQLIPEAVSKAYEQAESILSEILAEMGTTQADAFITHTSRIRTMYTGQALVAGALRMRPQNGTIPPQSQDDLKEYDFSAIEANRETRLDFYEPFLNMRYYRSHEGQAAGVAHCVDHWLAHPYEREHAGEPIEPYSSLQPRVEAALSSALRKLEGKDFGTVITHSGLIETAIITLINSARKTPVTSCADIGGAFNMGDWGYVVMDKTPSGVYTATLERNGQRYNVDLEKLR